MNSHNSDKLKSLVFCRQTSCHCCSNTMLLQPCFVLLWTV